MNPSRALPVVSGVVALGCAALAVLLDQVWLVALAGVLALASVAVVLHGHRAPRPRRPTASERTEEAQQLEREHDQALARAARFEAEAIRARAQLAETMRRAERVETPPDPAERSDLAAIFRRSDRSTDLIIDPATGLFTEVFFDTSLVKRISAARRGLRPLSIAVAEVVTGVGTPDMAQAVPAPIARIMTSVFREADTLARSTDGHFLILLEDTPENGAIWTLERVRRRIAEELPGHTIWVGLSCYPAYGFEATQLSAQARAALATAKEWQQDRIEVTTATPDA
jgi:GGDEF domain-containing protein